MLVSKARWNSILIDSQNPKGSLLYQDIHLLLALLALKRTHQSWDAEVFDLFSLLPMDALVFVPEASDLR
jgi:hypothetical protein